jgi:O-antigen/teichoic acid export membrane protein
MQMTIHFSRGEVQETREVQSAGLRILLATFVLFNTALLAIFLVPLDSLLQLTITRSEAQWTLYILGCQIVAGMVFGFFSGSYMVVGAAHRGTNFANVNQLAVLLLQLGLAIRHAPFHLIAAAQLGVTMALLYSSNVLAYQLPTLLMQRLLGPGTVVVYSVTRTIYSMSRRLLYLLTNSIGPEITMAFGQRDWKKLHKLYEFSERVILFMTAPITCGSMLATPLLLQLWLHKGNLYDPDVCLLLGITVSVLGIKEHKYQFQFSSNQVQAISYMTVLAYGAQLLLAAPMMMRFGLTGYVAMWCANEILQLFYLLGLNVKLFGDTAVIDRRPVYRLFGILAVGSIIVLWPMYHMQRLSAAEQCAIAVVAALAALALSYRVFDVDEIRSILWSKVTKRSPSVPT